MKTSKIKTLLFVLLFGGGLIAQTPACVPTCVLVGYYTYAINQQLLSISTAQFEANGFVSNSNTSCE